MLNTAPIALFVYNRPAHTRKTVECLAKNEGAQSSVLHVFSDAARTPADEGAVNEVRNYIRGISGFKEVIIVEKIQNFGLAKSIISGVTGLCEKYDRVIVLEDDLETAPYFLKFMNEALDYYVNTPEVMHISGCRYPVSQFGIADTFFLHVPFCWGWGTWRRAWKYFDKDVSVMNKFSFKMKYRFDFDGTYTNWVQLRRNRSGRINTWFVFWYAILFLRGGLALFPARSLVRNIGMDASGTHSPKTVEYSVELSQSPIRIESIALAESATAYEMHKKFFLSLRMQPWVRVKNALHRILP